jgi:hypothetical protein
VSSLNALVAFAAMLLLGNALAQKDEALEDEARQQKVARRVLTHGEVCPDPQRPCSEFKRFEPNELSFRITRKFDFDRGQDRSAPFYAVILKSGELCGLPEAERVAAQAQFPGRKVFAHRYFCRDFSDSVTYTNVNRKAGFVAVYGGKTEAEAKAFLAEVHAAGKFPDANLRRMQVVLVYQLE